MKLTFKNEWKGVATIGIISAFLLISHSGLAALIPFRLVPKAPVVEDDQKLIGRLIRDDEYELSPEWLIRRDGQMCVNYKGKTVYEELLQPGSQWKPLILPDTAGSGYLKDLNGDTNPDFIIEQTTNADGTERFNYTLYSIVDGHVLRFASEDSPKPWNFRDFNKDGVYELVQSDVSFTDFANNTHLGQPQEVVCAWGSGWSFATDIMKRKQLKPAEMHKLAEDISSKIIRYDTVDTASGKPAKRIEIHPNAWTPIVELIYHGDAVQAKQLLDTVWHADETAMLDTGSDTVTDRETFWKQIWTQIETSPFAADLKRMNNINS